MEFFSNIVTRKNYRLKILNCRCRIYKGIFIFAFCILNMQLSFADTNPNVWDVLRQEFRLNHEANRPEVQQQIRWLVAHPSYVQKLAKAEPYMYHIITELKKRNLPGEIALMPMIESAYNPFARSSAGAAGLWQIMPLTGREYGLRQSWWYDTRRAISPSTRAALTYLAYLNKYFHGNWTLTIAAYDAGEGSVARSLRRAKKNSRNVHFWSLNLPRETRFYIPKLYALAEVIKHPNRYHVQLPHIEHRPYFKEITIDSQIDLGNAAKLAGVSYQSLLKLNPEYNRSATTPGATHKILIPVHRVEKFKKNLAAIPKDKRITWSMYKLSNGESMLSVANKYKTTIKHLQELNKLTTTSLKNQQYLLVPKKTFANAYKKPATFEDLKRYKVIHIVSSDDTYESLQDKYKVTSEELKRWNQRLALAQGLVPGQSIVIWKSNASPGNYVVRSGDSLSQIALVTHKNVNELMELNPGLNKNKIKPGQTIKLS